MSSKLSIFLFVIAIALIGASQSAFIVDQREQAIVLQLGQPKGDIKGPGLHFKIPVVQEVRYFDRRVLSVDPAPAQVVISSANLTSGMSEAEQERITSGKSDQVISGEPIIVDGFARYKIIDPLQFMKTLRTISGANQRLETILNDAMRTVLGKTTLPQLLSERRTRIMEEIKQRVNQKIEEDKFGLEMVDVRIVRADLTPELRASTVRRMISELKERATETRSKGEESALEIRSTAEKERAVLIANAGRDAQIIRGKGDEQSIKIYADAFNKDKDFYGFIRSMEAYRNTLSTSDTNLILTPNSEFFKYFGDMKAK